MQGAGRERIGILPISATKEQTEPGRTSFGEDAGNIGRGQFDGIPVRYHLLQPDTGLYRQSRRLVPGNQEKDVPQSGGVNEERSG